MTEFDVVVAGAGAAGMMCAIEAGRRGRKVLVVDHARAPGESANGVRLCRVQRAIAENCAVDLAVGVAGKGVDRCEDAWALVAG